MKKEQILFRDLFSLVGFPQGEDDMFLYVTAADAVDVVAQSERVTQTRRCVAVYLIYSHFTASQENCYFDLTFGNFWGAVLLTL